MKNYPSWSGNPKQQPPDENCPQYKNKRNIYLGKLNDKLIKEPKQSTLDYYKVKFDDKEGIYY